MCQNTFLFSLRLCLLSAINSNVPLLPPHRHPDFALIIRCFLVAVAVVLDRRHAVRQIVMSFVRIPVVPNFGIQLLQGFGERSLPKLGPFGIALSGSICLDKTITVNAGLFRLYMSCLFLPVCFLFLYHIHYLIISPMILRRLSTASVPNRFLFPRLPIRARFCPFYPNSGHLFYAQSAYVADLCTIWLRLVEFGLL